jgi:maltose O-acetyltransferase
MTEEEKIFAGKMFNGNTPELFRRKHRTHELCRLINQMDECDPKRMELVRTFIGGIGEHSGFRGPIQFNYGWHTFIGSHFFANFNLLVMDDGRVFIGDNVAMGPNVSLLATNHPLLPQERMGPDKDGNPAFAEYADDIHIGDNVWLAANVCVLGGVTIGEGAVVGAGSVVTKDIPAGYLAYGNPCRAVRPITQADSQRQRVLPEDYDHFTFARP